MVSRGRTLLRGNTAHPGRDQDRFASRRTDTADAGCSGSDASNTRAGIGCSEGDRSEIHRMFSKVRERRSGCVQLGVEREHEARMGQETEAKKRSAVCRNMNLPFTFSFTVPCSSFDLFAFLYSSDARDRWLSTLIRQVEHTLAHIRDTLRLSISSSSKLQTNCYHITSTIIIYMFMFSFKRIPVCLITCPCFMFPSSATWTIHINTTNY